MALRLEKMADVLYEAFVLWWDTHILAVICPLCSEVECHDAQFEQESFNWDERLILTALCRSTGVTCEAIFPWKIGLGWEKDWKRKRLQTIGLDLSKFGIRDCWQPTLMTIHGPPLRTKEDPLFWGTRVTKSYVEDSMLHLEGRQGNAKANESEREKQESDYPQVSPFSPRIVLGDMRLIRSQRPKSNLIQILAPSATIHGNPLPGPLAWVSSNAMLEHKTAAVLNRKGSYPPIVAISGWKEFSKNTNNVLDQDFWPREVREISECLSHKLDAHNLDNGMEGRVCSSHAEKQLIAFFLRMHYFLEGEFEEAKMAKLKMIPPHLRLREAWIGVDTPPCDNCKAFKESVESSCDIRLHFVLMKKELRFRKDNKNNIEEPSTRIKSKPARLFPLTPPDSGIRQLKEHVQDKQEERNEESSDDEDDDLESPCKQRTLRSVNARMCHKDSNASNTRNICKRVRAASEEEESDYDSEYTPLSSQTKRFLPDSKKSTPSVVLTQESPYQALKQPHDHSCPQTPPRQCKNRPKHPRYPKPSNAYIRTAINEVSDSIERQERVEEQQDEDASTDSDTPIAPTRGTPKPMPERVVIDLTGDTTEEGDDSEGSCFSP